MPASSKRTRRDVVETALQAAGVDPDEVEVVPALTPETRKQATVNTVWRTVQQVLVAIVVVDVAPLAMDALDGTDRVDWSELGRGALRAVIAGVTAWWMRSHVPAQWPGDSDPLAVPLDEPELEDEPVDPFALIDDLVERYSKERLYKWATTIGCTVTTRTTKRDLAEAIVERSHGELRHPGGD